MAFYVSYVLKQLNEIREDPTLASSTRRHLQTLSTSIEILQPFYLDAQRKYLMSDDQAAQQFDDELDATLRELEMLLDDYNLSKVHSSSSSSWRRHFKIFGRSAASWRPQQSKIDSIQKSIHKIAEREKGRWQAQHIPSFHSDLLRDSSIELISRLSGTDEFISSEGMAERLIVQLVDPEVPRRAVISIVGPGGVGKTALAQYVYNHESITKHFLTRCQVLVVPVTDYILDLLKRILKGLIGLSDVIMVGMNEQEIKTKISNYLKTQRYLIVMDGPLDKEDWSSIADAFPDEQKGSRVVIVADEFDDPDVPFEMSYLRDDDIWKIFCQKSFPDGGCPPDLLQFKDAVVKTCEGLPLATVLLAGVLLSKEQSSVEWGKVLNYNEETEGKQQEPQEEGNISNCNRETEGEEGYEPENDREKISYNKETNEEKRQPERDEENSSYNRETEGEEGYEPEDDIEKISYNKETNEEKRQPERDEENSSYIREIKRENTEIEDRETEGEKQEPEEENITEIGETEGQMQEGEVQNSNNNGESDGDSKEPEKEEENSDERGSKVFLILFNELHHDLMICLLYLAAFPLNSSIDAQDLMHLWIAEGLIHDTDGTNGPLTMEDLAVMYLQGLIKRSLAQPLETDEFGRTTIIRIQTTLHAFVRFMANEVAFLHIYDNDSDFANTDVPVRRNSIHGGISDYLSRIVCDDKHTYLRTLICVSHDGFSFAEELNLQNNKLLKVIDLQGVRLKNLAAHIGDLSQLRFLCLRNTCLTMLPSSIGNLKNLQMLDLRGTRVAEVVESFWDIRSLRHIYVPVYFFTSQPTPHSNLEKLQTLDGLLSGNWVNKLATMSNLRQLTLVNVSVTEEKALGDAIEKLKRLRSLKLEGNSLPANMFTLTDLDGLEEIELSGPLGSRPWVLNIDNQELLPNLTVLRLINAGLGQDDINMLGKLPNLHSLAMWKSYSKRKMEFPSDSFSSLKELELLSLRELEELEVKEDAMPNLERLTITSCKLTMLPAGWVHNKLQNISVRHVPITDKQIEDYLKMNFKKMERKPSIFRL